MLEAVLARSEGIEFSAGAARAAIVNFAKRANDKAFLHFTIRQAMRSYRALFCKIHGRGPLTTTADEAAVTDGVQMPAFGPNSAIVGSLPFGAAQTVPRAQSPLSGVSMRVCIEMI